MPAEANGTHLLENVTVNIVCYGADGAPGGGDDYSGSMDTGTNGQPDGHFKFLVPPGPCTLSYDTADTAAYPEATTPTSLHLRRAGGRGLAPSRSTSAWTTPARSVTSFGMMQMVMA